MEPSRASTLFSSVFPGRDPSSSLFRFTNSRRNRVRTYTYTGISCQSIRRHRRRRDMGLENRQKAPSHRNGSSAENTRGAGLHDDTVVITLDPQHVKQRVETLTEAAKKAVHASAVRTVHLSKAMLNDGRSFFEDLRSSVSVQRDSRVVISLHRSSIDFALSVLLWSALLVVAWKILVEASKKYRWGWEESFDARQIMRRDRSLGGREVFVGRNSGVDQRAGRKKQDSLSARRSMNPLDAVEISRSEKDMPKQRESKPFRKVCDDLPGWWPLSTNLSATMPMAAPLGDQTLQEKASFLLRMIIEKRLTGKDFEADDVLQLRRLCKYSGAKVAFDSTNARDSFYRAAVDMVLTSCGRSTEPGVDMGGELAAEFLAGLADNISLEAERAAIMVNAAVAARTRSSFLQAWALQVQGRYSEADREVTQLSNILAALPPNANSPEMEMVAQGLGKHLSSDERSRLLEIYVRTGRSSTERIASEALGLHPTSKRL